MVMVAIRRHGSFGCSCRSGDGGAAVWFYNQRMGDRKKKAASSFIYTSLSIGRKFFWQIQTKSRRKQSFVGQLQRCLRVLQFIFDMRKHDSLMFCWFMEACTPALV